MQNPLTIVIFGATGDLYQAKLADALFKLFTQGLLPTHFGVIGFARKPLSDEQFQDLTRNAIIRKRANDARDQQEALANFLTHVTYMQGDLQNIESFKNLSATLELYDKKKNVCTNKLFYLAVPPSLYEVIFQNISGAGLTVPCAPGVADTEKAWTRVLVEKPFGNDLAHARKLDKMLGDLFDESQIFRIDHYLAYLAKGIVEKILNLRFGHRENESSWDNENVQMVRIVFHEKDLVGKRGAFFDPLGILVDMGQNHMLQMLALVAMDNPFGKNGVGVHKARQKVLEKVHISEKHQIVRGQYEGYKKEPGVRENSTAETFFRCTLFVDNPKWVGVPFMLELGKALNKSEVFIEVCFKETMSCIDFPVSNESTLRDAYEKVFYDCIVGDQTIFASTGEIMAQWRIATDIIKMWQNIPLIIYEKGSTGESIH